MWISWLSSPLTFFKELLTSKCEARNNLGVDLVRTKAFECHSDQLLFRSRCQLCIIKWLWQYYLWITREWRCLHSLSVMWNLGLPWKSQKRTQGPEHHFCFLWKILFQGNKIKANENAFYVLFEAFFLSSTYSQKPLHNLLKFFRNSESLGPHLLQWVQGLTCLMCRMVYSRTLQCLLKQCYSSHLAHHIT